MQSDCIVVILHEGAIKQYKLRTSAAHWVQPETFYSLLAALDVEPLCLRVTA